MALIDNIVSYWTLDETSGTRADSHGNNDLTDNNTVGSATGIINNGADFETSSSEYLSITDASQSGLDITGDLSISCWVKFESLPSSNAWSIISKMTGGGSGRQYFCGYDNGWHSGANRLYFFTYQSSTLSCNAYYAWTPSTGVWYHLAFTHDAAGASGNGVKLFYINGTAQTTVYATQAGGAIQNTNVDFRIGADNDPSIGRFFDGLIDEVGIWSKVLTQQEVTDLYNGGAGLAYPFSSPTNSNFFLFMQ